MRTQAIMSVGLLSLGLALPVWASPRAQAVPSAQEGGPPSLNAPRQKSIMPPLPPRGQQLYENHCMSCHASVVHIRTRQHVQSLPELQARVVHWAAFLKLRWGQQEVGDVVRHLDDRYYRFESRPGITDPAPLPAPRD